MVCLGHGESLGVNVRPHAEAGGDGVHLSVPSARRRERREREAGPVPETAPPTAIDNARASEPAVSEHHRGTAARRPSA